MENGNNCNGELVSPRRLAPSASFKAKKKPIVPNSVSRPGSEADDFINQLHGSDPLRVELTRLENDLKDKDRDLGEAQAEIKALRYSERLKQRAVEELTDELQKVDEKLKATEALLENKNLEIKKINEEKKASLAAQFAAEATLRRVHAAQKDDDMPPIEAIIAPLEAELKLARSEIAKLQDDNRALDRLTKSKESALLEVEKTVQLAMAKAAMVDDLQNKNQELMKQIEICQEENKILDKMHRQKVADVEKLMQSVHELEEAVLAGGAAANAVREYQRKVQEMNEEKRILDRELARTKISANRVAVVVANEWKDGNDKVMPVKQWLEERRFLQGEMQQLKDKLTVAERTAKAEAQLKEKYQLRFKVLEERLKAPPNGSNRSVPEGRSLSKGQLQRKSFEGLNLFRPSTNGISLRKSSTLPRNRANSLLNQDTSMSGSSNDSNTSLDNGNVSLVIGGTDNGSTSPVSDIKTNDTISTHENGDGCLPEMTKIGSEDFVSGVLYDMLQREVIALRKACHAKDRSLNDKEDAIEMLAKKVETLNRAMEVEAKKTRREMSAMEKEVATLRNGKEQDRRLRNGGISRSRGSMNGSIFK